MYESPSRKNEPTANENDAKIDGRIVVDAASYFHANPDERQSLSSLNSECIAPQVNVADEKHFEYNSDDYMGPRCGTSRLCRLERRERTRHREIENGELPTERKIEPCE